MGCLVAIFGGCDWADASIDHLVSPIFVNQKDIAQYYREWIQWKQHYFYTTFSEWLKNEHGFVEAIENVDIITFMR